MKQIDNILLSENDSIKKALEIIDRGALKIALIVDNNKKLLGTVTDGDIRRGLLKGVSLEDQVSLVMHKNPFVAKMSESRDLILKKALEKKIYQIPIVDENGIVIGIEVIEELIKPKEKNNKVILMVGGLGTRLRPLTEKVPKPLLKVGDKPILETIIENFKKYGFVNFILTINYKGEMIKDYFKDGSKFGVNIEYVEEKKRMGTAGSLSLLKERPKEPFFVMNGDLLTTLNYEHFLDYHISNNSIATMAVKEYEIQVPFGVVNLEDNRIVSIEEKPIHKFFVNAGIYVLSPECLDYIPKDEYFDMPSLFKKLIEDNKKTVSFPIREYWMDIGRLEEYERANREYWNYFGGEDEANS